jgi:hypothetical protein
MREQTLADKEVETAKRAALQYRLAIATFVRGCGRLGSSSLCGVLECLIGPGPQVARFIRYRGSLKDQT